jgi:hypothetical protein
LPSPQLGHPALQLQLLKTVLLQFCFSLLIPYLEFCNPCLLLLD